MSEKRALASTYVVSQEIPERWKGHFALVTVYRGILPPFKNESQLADWLRKKKAEPTAAITKPFFIASPPSPLFDYASHRSATRTGEPERYGM